MFEIRRREFIRSLSALTCAVATWPFRCTRAGARPNLSSRGLAFEPTSHAVERRAIRGVKTDGFIEGQNLLLDQAGFGLWVDELAAHAAAIAKAQVDVIVATGDPPVRSAQQATKSIPILAIAEDMVGSGFVALPSRDACRISKDRHSFYRRQCFDQDLLPFAIELGAEQADAGGDALRFGEGSGLMSYGPDLKESFERVGDLAARVFAGAKPGDLPFEEPTKYLLVINLKTAKASGIELPTDFLALADEVIE